MLKIDDFSIALIPAYKPGDNLIALLEDLNRAGFVPVVVDDGSGERYAPLFEEAARHAAVLSHPRNQGKGRALKTGLAYIQETYGTGHIVVTFDADGQHSVEDAIRIRENVRLHPDALILGQRCLTKQAPFRSRLGNAVTCLIFHLFTGVRLYDTQTGLRGFSGEFIPRLLKIHGERYEYELNVLLDSARKRIPIREIPIDTIYIGRNVSSHFRMVKDSLRIVKEIIKFCASSFFCFCIDCLLYGLLLMLTGNLLIANISARVVSATLNYILNRKFIFRSNAPAIKTALEYFCLAAAILAGNSALLTLLINHIRINAMLAKILANFLFFFVNWAVQRFVIFRSSNKPKNPVKDSDFSRKA